MSEVIPITKPILQHVFSPTLEPGKIYKISSPPKAYVSTVLNALLHDIAVNHTIDCKSVLYITKDSISIDMLPDDLTCSIIRAYDSGFTDVTICPHIHSLLQQKEMSTQDIIIFEDFEYNSYSLASTTEFLKTYGERYPNTVLIFNQRQTEIEATKNIHSIDFIPQRTVLLIPGKGTLANGNTVPLLLIKVLRQRSSESGDIFIDIPSNETFGLPPRATLPQLHPMALMTGI